MKLRNSFDILLGYTFTCLQRILHRQRVLLFIQMIGLCSAYTLGAALEVGGDVLVHRSGFGKGPWPVLAIAGDGTVSLKSVDGKVFDLKRGEYTPVVKSLKGIDDKSEIIVHALEGQGILPVKGIGADGTLLSILNEKWVQYSPKEYTVLVPKAGGIEKGGYVFPLKSSQFRGAWPVISLGADGTVVTSDTTGKWSRFRSNEYIPAVKMYGGVSVGDNVIVIREGLINVWVVNHIGKDGRISIWDESVNHYHTFQKDKYLPTVSKYKKLKVTDKVFLKREGFTGLFNIIAMGNKGQVVISGDTNGNTKLYLVDKSEYMPTVNSLPIETETSRIKAFLGGFSNLMIFPIPPVVRERISGTIRKMIPLKKTKDKKLTQPIPDQPIQAGNTVLLRAQTRISAFKTTEIKMEVYVLGLLGDLIEVVPINLVNKVMTEKRNSLSTYAVPKSWLSVPLGSVLEAKGDIPDAYIRNKHYLRGTFKTQVEVLEYLKELSLAKGIAGIHSNAGCVGTLATVGTGDGTLPVVKSSESN